jgi:hypothetical protein
MLKHLVLWTLTEKAEAAPYVRNRETVDSQAGFISPVGAGN